MEAASLVLTILALAALAALPPSPRVRHDREVRRSALARARLGRARSVAAPE